MELDVNTFNMQPSSNTHERIQTEVIWEYLIEGVLKLQGDLNTSISFI